MFRHLRPLIRRADLALCHVETPLVPGSPAGYPRFRTPDELAWAIRATGWDACSTASNHSLDAGQAGVDSTVRALRRAGLRHTGSFASRRAHVRPLIVRVGGARLAFLAYTTSTNGIARPHPWSVNLARPGRIVRDARRARGAGAQVVIVNLHWGSEYRHVPDLRQRRLATRLMRSGAITAIIGQHAHVVQPIRRVRGRWVVYGEGNLLSNQSSVCCPAATQDGIVAFLHVRIDGSGGRVERISYTPTWVRRPDYTVLPVGRAIWKRQATLALCDRRGDAPWRSSVAQLRSVPGRRNSRGKRAHNPDHARSGWFMCRVGFVETARAVDLVAGETVVRRFAEEWPACGIVEVDQDLAERAAGLATADDLRSLDALRVAAALLLPRADLRVATWDPRLYDAARDQGLRVLPDRLA